MLKQQQDINEVFNPSANKAGGKKKEKKSKENKRKQPYPAHDEDADIPMGRPVDRDRREKKKREEDTQPKEEEGKTLFGGLGEFLNLDGLREGFQENMQSASELFGAGVAAVPKDSADIKKQIVKSVILG